MLKKTTDQIIQMISETLSQADGKFIENIANSVLTEHVTYSDGLFVISFPKETEEKKKRTFPINEDCPLNEYEEAGLNKILDEVEWREYQQVKHQTSGYVESRIVDYDEETVNFEITIGVDGEWRDTIDYSIKRLELLLAL